MESKYSMNVSGIDFGKRQATISLVGQKGLIDKIFSNIAGIMVGNSLPDYIRKENATVDTMELMGIKVLPVTINDILALMEIADSLKDDAESVEISAKIKVIAGYILMEKVNKVRDDYRKAVNLPDLSAYLVLAKNVIGASLDKFQEYTRYDVNDPIAKLMKFWIHDINVFLETINDTIPDQTLIAMGTMSSARIREILRQLIEAYTKLADRDIAYNDRVIAGAEERMLQAIHGKGCSCQACREIGTKRIAEAVGSTKKDALFNRLLREPSGSMRDPKEQDILDAVFNSPGLGELAGMFGIRRQPNEACGSMFGPDSLGDDPDLDMYEGMMGKPRVSGVKPSAGDDIKFRFLVGDGDDSDGSLYSIAEGLNRRFSQRRFVIGLGENPGDALARAFEEMGFKQ